MNLVYCQYMYYNTTKISPPHSASCLSVSLVSAPVPGKDTPGKIPPVQVAMGETATCASGVFVPTAEGETPPPQVAAGGNHRKHKVQRSKCKVQRSGPASAEVETGCSNSMQLAQEQGMEGIWIMCPYASCNDCCIVHSTSAGADPELVNGGGGWSCMLLLHLHTWQFQPLQLAPVVFFLPPTGADTVLTLEQLALYGQLNHLNYWVIEGTRMVGEFFISSG